MLDIGRVFGSASGREGNTVLDLKTVVYRTLHRLIKGGWTELFLENISISYSAKLRTLLALSSPPPQPHLISQSPHGEVDLNR